MKLDSAGPILVLVRGLPGGGKSYITSIVAKKLAQQTCILDPDATDYDSKEYKTMCDKLRAEGVDEKFYPYRFLRDQAYEGIKTDKIIIWNQAFTNLEMFQKTILNLETYASDHDKELQVLVVEVEIDVEVAKKRVAERAGQGGHDVDEQTFSRLINDYKTFEKEGFNLVKINGEDNPEVSASRVVEALKNLSL